LYNQAAFLFLLFTCHQGASNTVISSTTSFIYLMAVNPDIQCIAQREIDCVIGENRLPTFDDRASLPYIEAIYRELLRFAPPVPLCIPHSTTEDDHYKGYFIPKGNFISA
jgi:cytochrome P450